MTQDTAGGNPTQRANDGAGQSDQDEARAAPAVRNIEALLVETKEHAGVTMILTNHHIGSTLRMADQVVFLAGGGAISGSVEEFRHNEDPRIVGFLDAAGPGRAPVELPDAEEVVRRR